ncbi:MAG: hypothetical protein LUI87_10050 [Lachnospiraceae bacterium]|nr:hypothetical protein [Lachnospiraceae bacterium]
MDKKKGYITLLAVFAVISVIVFAVPTEKAAGFWISYVFLVIAFVAQVAIWQVSSGKKDSVKDRFLGIPAVYIGSLYLIAQIIITAVFTAIPSAPAWVALIACVVTVGISVICLIGVKSGTDEIQRVDEKVQKKVSFIQDMQDGVESLADREQNKEIKEALQKLSGKIRFSDPMSSAELEGIENEIRMKMDELKASSDKLAVIQELDLLFNDRNRKCKRLK